MGWTVQKGGVRRSRVLHHHAQSPDNKYKDETDNLENETNDDKEDPEPRDQPGS